MSRKKKRETERCMRYLSTDKEEIIRITKEEKDVTSEIPTEENYHSHFCFKCDKFCSESCENPCPPLKRLASGMSSVLKGVGTVATSASIPLASGVLSAGCGGLSVICGKYSCSKPKSLEFDRPCIFISKTNKNKTSCSLESCNHELRYHVCYGFTYTVTKTKVTRIIQEQTVNDSEKWKECKKKMQENELALKLAKEDLKIMIKEICKKKMRKRYT